MIFFNIKTEKNNKVGKETLKKKNAAESCRYVFVYMKKKEEKVFWIKQPLW